jgi:hypothetical protein
LLFGVCKFFSMCLRDDFFPIFLLFTISARASWHLP